jgi:hypothetical protein
MFSPTLTTLQHAIRNNHLVGFPGLTLSALRDFPPTTVATAKGHLDQNRQHKQPSHKPTQTIPYLPSPIITPVAPSMEPNDHLPNDDYMPPQNEPTQFCFAAIVPIEKTGQVYSDQTGRFPTPSSTGNTQIFVLNDYDSNSIHAVPMPTKTAADILAAYTSVVNTLIHAGLRPKLQRMDNECSNVLKRYMDTENIQYQVVPPGVHRANSAERAIRTFKNHFIAGLATTDPNFPIRLTFYAPPASIPSSQRMHKCLASITSPHTHWHHQAPTS